MSKNFNLSSFLGATNLRECRAGILRTAKKVQNRDARLHESNWKNVHKRGSCGNKAPVGRY